MIYNQLVVPKYLNVCFNEKDVTMSIVFPIKPQTVEFVEKELRHIYGDTACVKRGKKSWVAGVKSNIPYSGFGQELINLTWISKQKVLNAIHTGYSKYYRSLIV